jgi:transposase-like protein
MQDAITGQVLEFRRRIRDLLKERLLEAVEIILAEELSQVLGSESYERTAGRRGYRNGVEVRRLTTVAGTRELRVPRGRVKQQDGSTQEFRSEILPRYARRTRRA